MRPIASRLATVRVVLAAVAALSAACGSAPVEPTAAAPAAPVQSEDQRFEALLAEFMPAFWRQNPTYAIYTGVYDHAGVLEAYDQAARDKEAAFYAGWAKRLDGFDLKRLSANNRTDLELIRGGITAGQWYLDTFKSWQWQPTSYNVAGSFEVLLNTEYAPLETRLRAVSERLAVVPAYYAAAQRQHRDPVARAHRPRHRPEQGRARDLRRWDDQAKANESALSVRFREGRVRTPCRGGARRHRGLCGVPRRTCGPALAKGEGVRSFRIGNELYQRKFMLDSNTGFTADELHQRALKEKAWLHDQMAARAAALWPKYFPKEKAPDRPPGVDPPAARPAQPAAHQARGVRDRGPRPDPRAREVRAREGPARSGRQPPAQGARDPALPARLRRARLGGCARPLRPDPRHVLQRDTARRLLARAGRVVPARVQPLDAADPQRPRGHPRPLHPADARQQEQEPGQERVRRRRDDRGLGGVRRADDARRRLRRRPRPRCGCSG